jgi:hypothetical protein
MTPTNEVEIPYCGNCTNDSCDLSNKSLEEAQKFRILDVGRIMMMRCTTERYGCASHPRARQYLNKDVIEELERLNSEADALGYTEFPQSGLSHSINYEDMVKLLKECIPKKS